MKSDFDVGDYVRYFTTDGSFDGKVIAFKSSGVHSEQYLIKWSDHEASKWLSPRCLKKLIEPNDIIKQLL